jgi:hypothetical protein
MLQVLQTHVDILQNSVLLYVSSSTVTAQHSLTHMGHKFFIIPSQLSVLQH